MNDPTWKVRTKHSKTTKQTSPRASSTLAQKRLFILILGRMPQLRSRI